MDLLIKLQADQADGTLRTVDVTPEAAFGPLRIWRYQVDAAFHRLLSPLSTVTSEIVRPFVRED